MRNLQRIKKFILLLCFAIALINFLKLRSPIRTDVLTLFISGTLDANTPPFQAEEVRKNFKRSLHLIVENAGHESMLPNQLVQQTILDFLRGRDVTHVKIALPTLKFLPITHP